MNLGGSSVFDGQMRPCFYAFYIRRGAGGALAPPEFGGSEKRTERETDSLLLIAPAPPRNQNPNVVPELYVTIHHQELETIF